MTADPGKFILLIAPLMELKFMFSTEHEPKHDLLIAPLMELKFHFLLSNSDFLFF